MSMATDYLESFSDEELVKAKEESRIYFENIILENKNRFQERTVSIDDFKNSYNGCMIALSMNPQWGYPKEYPQWIKRDIKEMNALIGKDSDVELFDILKNSETEDIIYERCYNLYLKNITN